MGSVVISDIVSDFARYPHTMVVGDHQPSSSTGNERAHNSSTSSHNPQHSGISSYPQQRTPSTSTNPSSRSASQNPQDSTAIAAPSERGPIQRVTRHEIDEEDGYDRSGFPLTSAPRGLGSSGPPSPQLLPTIRSSVSLIGLGPGSPPRIKVRDLNHIQTFASEEVLTRSQYGSRHSLRGRQDGGQQYEISSMPVTDIIEMVAGLLTKITTTNDRQHEHIHRHIPAPDGTSGLSQQTASVLAFHGKNVPSITILSYLSRIHKYCPTTYEVFLSLLVYFDRMTETINSGTLHSFRNSGDTIENGTGSSSNTNATDYVAAQRAPTSTTASSSASSSQTQPRSGGPSSPSMPPASVAEGDASRPPHMFVVDSFNIHRLVIAGVTCASKFFSDVFYTNSRYAKVGGLPIPELNHLELQFLLLNDFRLSVPVEELEAYGSMLVEFYAKEVVAHQLGTHSNDALYMAQAQSPTPAH